MDFRQECSLVGDVGRLVHRHRAQDKDVQVRAGAALKVTVLVFARSPVTVYCDGGTRL